MGVAGPAGPVNPPSARQVVEPVAPPVAELSGQLQPIYVVAGVVVQDAARERE